MPKSATIPLLCLSLIALLPLPAHCEPKPAADLAAKAAYEKAVKQKTPGAQQVYVNQLAGILDGDITKFIATGDRSTTAQLDRIYAELKKFPAPANSDSAAFTKLRLGKWESPRHQYLYRANGTWSMLPLESDATAGHWRIEGNRAFDGLDAHFAAADQFTIILLDKKYFIFMQGDTVFFEHRL